MAKEFITWNKSWATEIKKIDEQHHHFVDLVNQTYALNESGKDGENLARLLADATEYARVHFSTEEEYFEETDYPETVWHEEKHGELLKKVILFNKKFEAGKEHSALVKEFLEFLRDWLDNHLVKVDHKYVPWLTGHGIK